MGADMLILCFVSYQFMQKKSYYQLRQPLIQLSDGVGNLQLSRCLLGSFMRCSAGFRGYVLVALLGRSCYDTSCPVVDRLTCSVYEVNACQWLKIYNITVSQRGILRRSSYDFESGS
eukprot:scaffold253110_cov31-Tisochrysis_lutea.AAC.1